MDIFMIFYACNETYLYSLVIRGTDYPPAVSLEAPEEVEGRISQLFESH
jgi:hypothetical protein